MVQEVFLIKSYFVLKVKTQMFTQILNATKQSKHFNTTSEHWRRLDIYKAKAIGTE